MRSKEGGGTGKKKRKKKRRDPVLAAESTGWAKVRALLLPWPYYKHYAPHKVDTYQRGRRRRRGGKRLPSSAVS
jgi:hypothetical protein